jgi:hypothetical protein
MAARHGHRGQVLDSVKDDDEGAGDGALAPNGRCTPDPSPAVTAVDPVIAIDRKEKPKECSIGFFVNGLVAQEPKWKDGRLEKSRGGTNVPVLGMNSAEAQPLSDLPVELLGYEAESAPSSCHIAGRRRMRS